MVSTFTDIVFAPLVAPWLLVVLAVPAAVIAVLGFFRGMRGARLRLLAAALFVLALANPLMVRESRTPRDDVAVVVIDRSTSQTIAERPERVELAANALEASLGRFAGLEVRTVTVGPDRREAEDGTRLYSALRAAVSEIPQGRLAGALVVSDGQVHDLPPDVAGAIGAPVHLLVTGRKGESDRRVVVDSAPAFGLVGESVEVAFTVEDRPGPLGGRGPVSVHLRRGAGGEDVMEVPAGQRVTVPLPIEHAGPLVMEIAAEAAPDELTTANNRVAVAVTGLRERLRVLLLSGQPHPGERTWRNLLKSDPSVDLVHFTILRPPEKEDFTPIDELALIPFPTRALFEDSLPGFDLVIFDRYFVRNVLPFHYFTKLADYLRDGGAVLLSVGPDFAGPMSLAHTPLGDILPARPGGSVTEAPFRPSLSDTGRRHPVTAPLERGEDQWGRWFRVVGISEDRGEVLMRGADDLPLLLVERIVEGRIAILASDQVWLWARGFEGGGPHGELLRRLVHWLMKEPDLEEEALNAAGGPDGLEIERRSLDPAPATVGVTAPDGTTREVTLTSAGGGRQTAEVSTTMPGLYRIEDGRHTAYAAVGALNPLELADPRATAQVMAPLLDATGGGVAWLERGDDIPDIRRVRPERRAAGRGWLGLVDNDAYTVTGVSEVPLLPGLVSFLLIAIALGGAWWREGR